MVRHTNPPHESQPAQEPALLYPRQPSFGWTQTHIVDDHGERVCVQQKVLCNWGLTLQQSAAVHIQALVSADGILLGFCWLTSAFSYKFSFSSGLTVGQFPNCTKPRALPVSLPTTPIKNLIMNKTSIITIVFLTICFLISCESKKNSSHPEKKVDEFVDYNNLQILDSMVKITSLSTDTLFLGFKIGMTKSDYKDHIKNLKKSGKTITYASSQILSTFVGNIQLGEGYTFETGISSGNEGQIKTGEGKYFLQPVYNNAGRLMQLNILPIEKWETDYGSERPNWLKTNILQNSSELNDENLQKALIDLKIIDGNHFVRRKGNVIIYEGNLTVTYIDLKTLFIEMMIKNKENEIKVREGKDVKF